MFKCYRHNDVLASRKKCIYQLILCNALWLVTFTFHLERVWVFFIIVRLIGVWEGEVLYSSRFARRISRNGLNVALLFMSLMYIMYMWYFTKYKAVKQQLWLWTNFANTANKAWHFIAYWTTWKWHRGGPNVQQLPKTNARHMIQSFYKVDMSCILNFKPFFHRGFLTSDQLYFHYTPWTKGWGYCKIAFKVITFFKCGWELGKFKVRWSRTDLQINSSDNPLKPMRFWKSVLLHRTLNRPSSQPQTSNCYYRLSSFGNCWFENPSWIISKLS